MSVCVCVCACEGQREGRGREGEMWRGEKGEREREGVCHGTVEKSMTLGVRNSFFLILTWILTCCIIYSISQSIFPQFLTIKIHEFNQISDRKHVCLPHTDAHNRYNLPISILTC